ncbi:MAG: hypothetical protein Q8R76_11490 [Candidatus Omnitrophota bacterium]|nr:hypothetical protein [Candidatus Omnitrophota bacterium]
MSYPKSLGLIFVFFLALNQYAPRAHSAEFLADPAPLAVEQAHEKPEPVLIRPKWSPGEHRLLLLKAKITQLRNLADYVSLSWDRDANGTAAEWELEVLRDIEVMYRNADLSLAEWQEEISVSSIRSEMEWIRNEQLRQAEMLRRDLKRIFPEIEAAKQKWFGVFMEYSIVDAVLQIAINEESRSIEDFRIRVGMHPVFSSLEFTVKARLTDHGGHRVENECILPDTGRLNFEFDTSELTGPAYDVSVRILWKLDLEDESEKRHAVSWRQPYVVPKEKSSDTLSLNIVA